MSGLADLRRDDVDVRGAAVNHLLEPSGIRVNRALVLTEFRGI
ncbi:hypothetical protein [Rhizobium leguminosarum]|nr:hypothetical protein [Rhizobium leguminosarum]